LIRQAIYLKIPVIVDPKKSDFSAYRGATVITPNTAELAATGQAVDDLIRDTGATLVIKSGADGLRVRGATYEEDHAAMSNAPLDVVGAGDTVVAALAVAFARGIDIRSACR